MSRENLLFSIIGLLLGYVVAFTLVVSINSNQAAAPRAVGGPQSPTSDALAEQLPPDHPRLSPEEREKLNQTVREASQQARSNASDFDAQVRAAHLNAQAGDFEEAIDFLTRANKLRPEDHETLVKLGLANFEAGRYDTSEQWYKAALAKKPDDVDVRADFAMTYFLQKPSRPERAVEEFRRALEVDPKHVTSLYYLTVVLKESGKLDEAESALARLEQVSPNENGLPRLREELLKARVASGPTGGGAAVRQ